MSYITRKSTSSSGSSNLTANIRATEGAGTTTLSNADVRNQVFDLTAGRNVDLPSTGVLKGDIWVLGERTGDFTLQIRSSAGNNIDTINAGEVTLAALVNAPTADTDWQILEHAFEPYQVESTWFTNTPNLATFEDRTSITLPPGTYRLDFSEQVQVAGDLIDHRFGITETAGATFGDVVTGYTGGYVIFRAQGVINYTLNLCSRVSVSDVATTWYAKSYLNTNAGGTDEAGGVLRATRIA